MIAAWGRVLLALSPGWAQESLRIESYNVGLAYGFVPEAEARLPLLQLALAQDDADILCLQEVWEPDDREAITESLAASYPHAWTLPVEQQRADDAPACRRRELFGEGRFVSCMSSDCGGLEGDDLTSCIVDRCGPILAALRDENPQCANALMAQVGKPALRALWTVLRPVRRANLYAYGGSDGLMLLSRVPLQGTGYIDFTDIATLNRRRALYADVALDGTTARVYCTHLTAILDHVAPYPGPFESWAEENLTQVDRLLAHAEAFGGPVAIVGDFNTGPGVPDTQIRPEAPAGHERILAAGYRDPVLSLRVCTYCGGENTLTGPKEEPKLIDHIYLIGLDGADLRRTHDRPVPSTDGKTLPLSDHYGVSARITLPPPEPEPVPDGDFPVTAPE